MGDPADSTRQGEDDGEHAGRNADGLEDDARVEVHVRVQVALGEVRIVEGDLFQLHGQIQLRIVDAQLAQNLVAGLFHDLGARIEVLVDAMAEAHQLERIVLVLGLGQELLDVRHVADFVQHGEYGFVRATVCRSPKGGDTGGDTGERVGTGGASQAHGGSRSVLLMIGMQDEDAIHGLGQHRADRFDLARGVEHHVQEVFRVAQVVARIHQRLTDRVLVNHRGDGRHLGDQAHGGNFAVVRIVDVQGVVVERRKGADNATHDGHGVGVTTETIEEGLQLLVNHGVVLHGADELCLLLGGRQFAVQQQVAGFQVVGFFRQLLDRVAAMQQDALVAIDVGDLGLARGGRHEAGIEGEVTRGGQASHVYYIRPYGTG